MIAPWRAWQNGGAARFGGTSHVGRQPGLEARQRFDSERPLVPDGHNPSAGRADLVHRHRCRLGTLVHEVCVFSGDDVTGSGLHRTRKRMWHRARGASSTAPMRDTIAISASATRIPPSEMSCTAVTRPSPINSRTNSPLRRSPRARSAAPRPPRGRRSRADIATGPASRGCRRQGGQLTSALNASVIAW